MNQLPLPFAHAPDFNRADFLWASSNEAARAWLARDAEWPQRRLALWGEPGSGKTHLLHLWANRRDAPVLAGAALGELSPGDNRDVAIDVAIDDADRCPEPTVLLHLLNRCAEAGATVLLAGRTPPARWDVTLPDLASRLRAVTAVQIAAPEDTLLRALLARLLGERQLALAPEQQDWLLLRLPRTAEAVREAVARLDHAALAAGRRPGRRMVSEVLAGLAPPGACEDFMASPESSSGGFEVG